MPLVSCGLLPIDKDGSCRQQFSRPAAVLFLGSASYDSPVWPVQIDFDHLRLPNPKADLLRLSGTVPVLPKALQAVQFFLRFPVAVLLFLLLLKKITEDDWRIEFGNIAI